MDAITDLVYKITVDGGAETEIDAAIAADDNLLRAALSVAMPELANASITRHAPKDGVVVSEMKKRAGTKGTLTKGSAGISPVESLSACTGGINPAAALYQTISRIDLNQLSPEAGLALDRQIEQALESGEAHKEQMERAIARLSAAHPTSAAVIVLGF